MPKKKSVEKSNWPSVSIVTCTYNGERIIEKYLKHIFMQDYPLDKMEVILSDGGSKDKTIKVLTDYKKRYPKVVTLFPNKKQYSIGKGYGMDNATRQAKGEIIVQLDQDNILIQKDWLKNMVKILVENPDITAVQSKLFIPDKGDIVDKYVNAVGIEDPFAIHYSLNAQVVLNPHKFKFNKKGKFYYYDVNKENFYYAGDNGFAIRRKDFLESGGYTQDIDNFWRMANANKKYRIAIPSKIMLHHQSTTNLKHLIGKRVYYIGHYLLKNYDDREFYWLNKEKNSFSQNFRFIKGVIYNLLFLPGLIQGIEMSFREKKSYWLIHGFVLWWITVNYLRAYIYAQMGKQIEADI